MKCAVNGCTRTPSMHSMSGFCLQHMTAIPTEFFDIKKDSMSTKYPKYYKPIPKGMTELDIYAVCQMFNVTDAAITHSLKKLMLPGVRTGGKSRHADIKEARDTLTRWLELNPEVKDHGNGYAK